MGATVLLGLTTGKECVVAGDVAPFTLVGGVPAKFIRYLDDPEEPKSQNGDQGNGVTNGKVELRKASESKLDSNNGVDNSPNRYVAKRTNGFETDLPRWPRTPPGL